MYQHAKFGLEAVSYQDKPTFFNELTKEIQRYRSSVPENRRNNDTVMEFQFDQIIRKHTGMNVTFMIDDRTKDVNAYVVMPWTREDHAMNSYSGNYPSLYGYEMNEALRKKIALESTVDSGTGKITGWFSELTLPIWVTKSLLADKPQGNVEYMTDEEVAAIILHEIGHAFTFFAEFHSFTKRNLIIEAHVKDFAKTEDKKQHTKIIGKMQAEKLLGKDFDEKTTIELGNKKGSLVIMTSAQKEFMEDPNSVFANSTMFESAADQYATRMGAGKYLSTALMKFYRASNTGFWPRFFYFRMQYFAAMRLMMFLLFGFVIALNIVISIIFFPIFLFTLFFSPHYLESGANILVGGWLDTLMKGYHSYDKPKDRLKRIHREMIGQLKQYNLPDHHRVFLLSEIDHIEKTIGKADWDGELVSHTTIENIFWGTVIGAFRRNNKTKEQQQLVESLLNNKLYADAARLL